LVTQHVQYLGPEQLVDIKIKKCVPELGMVAQATWEAKIGRISVKAFLGKKFTRRQLNECLGVVT
jgi:hypothetical protein